MQQVAAHWVLPPVGFSRLHTHATCWIQVDTFILLSPINKITHSMKKRIQKFVDVQIFWWTAKKFGWTSKAFFGFWTSKILFGRPKIFVDVQKYFGRPKFCLDLQSFFWTSKTFFDVQKMCWMSKYCFWTSRNVWTFKIVGRPNASERIRTHPNMPKVICTRL